MSITAIVENDTIKLPIHVPNGTQVEVNISPAGPEPVEIQRSGRGFPMVSGREKFSAKDVAQTDLEG